MFEAVEGAEGSTLLSADITALSPRPNDVLIGIAASGSTPHVLGASLLAAGALTIGTSTTPARQAPAEIGIVLDTAQDYFRQHGPPSNGTAQKIALNSFSSALMVRLNRYWQPDGGPRADQRQAQEARRAPSPYWPPAAMTPRRRMLEAAHYRGGRHRRHPQQR